MNMKTDVSVSLPLPHTLCIFCCRNFNLVIDQDDDFVGQTDDESRFGRASSSSMLHDKQWFTPQQLFLRSTLINSMIYLSMFYRFDFSNASLLHLLYTWTKLRQQTFQQKENVDKVDSVAEELRDDLIRLQSASALSKYVQLCIDFDIVKDEDSTFPTPFNRYDPLTMVASYAYSNLQAISRVPDYTDVIMNDILNLVGNSANDDARLHNILNFIRLMVPQLHFENIETLEKLIATLMPHLMRPAPIGEMTKEVMLSLQREIRNRGAAMRERFEHAVKRVEMPDGTVTHKRRIVYILLNGYAQNANTFTDRVTLENGFDETEIDVIKANLVLNIFDHLGDEPVSQLMTVPHDTLSRYYHDAATIMNDAESQYEGHMGADEVEAMVLTRLNALHRQIMADQESRREPLSVRRKSPQLPDVEIKLVELEKEKDISECPREFKIFPRSHIVDVLDNIVKEQRSEQPTGELVIDVAVAGGSGTLQHFVHSIIVAQRLKMMKEVDLRLYVIPLGENNFLSNWLEKYDGWYSRHVYYPFLSPLPIVPCLKTDNDPSQNPTDLTNLRRGSAQRSVVSIRTSMKPSSFKLHAKRRKAVMPGYEAPVSYLTPHRFMRSLLNNYFIDAHRPLPVHFYNVQCLSNEVVSIASPGTEGRQQQQILQTRSKVKEYVSICFCQRLDVGIIAESLQTQKTERLDNTTLEDIRNHRQFKYSGINLSISYVPMDSTGELSRTTEIQEPAKTYYSITVKSVSGSGDERSALVGPNQPWLEVTAEEFGIKRRRTRAKENDLVTNYHVGSISIESSGVHQFSVALDGEVYGPFHKILINPSTNTVNLQTFNRVDLF